MSFRVLAVPGYGENAGANRRECIRSCSPGHGKMKPAIAIGPPVDLELRTRAKAILGHKASVSDMSKSKSDKHRDSSREERPPRRRRFARLAAVILAVIALALGLLFSGWLLAQAARWPRVLRVAHVVADILPAGLRAYGYGIALDSSHGRVREEAARRLDELGPKARAAMPKLAKALKDRRAAVRRSALEALGKIASRSRSAVSEMETALKDHDWRIRERAAELLGQLREKGETAVPALVDALRDKHARVRAAAADALARIRARAEIAVPALRTALKDAVSDVRAAARKALEQIEGTEKQSKESGSDNDAD